MSLRPQPPHEIPVDTAQAARAAFRRDNPYLRVRDQLGLLFCDAEFADLYVSHGSGHLTKKWPAVSLRGWLAPTEIRLVPFSRGGVLVHGKRG